MKHVHFIVFLILAVLGHHQARAEFSPREFFVIAPASTFYTEDEMSDSDKEAIIKSRFKRTKSSSCTSWGVTEETSQSLTLGYCRDSFVRIYVYPSAGRNPLVIVQSVRSSGRASDLGFFRVDGESKKIKSLSSTDLTTIGIEPVTENDFVREKDRVKESEAEPATLLLEDHGDLRAVVETWMNPRWTNRDIAYDVTFTWNGERFHKRVAVLPLH
jgi:hypothetical protein